VVGLVYWMYVFCLLILFGMFVVDGGDNSCLYVWMVYWFDSLGLVWWRFGFC